MIRKLNLLKKEASVICYTKVHYDEKSNIHHLMYGNYKEQSYGGIRIIPRKEFTVLCDAYNPIYTEIKVQTEDIPKLINILEKIVENEKLL